MNKVGSNQYKTKRKKDVGAYMIGFLYLMIFMVFLYDLNITFTRPVQASDIISPVAANPLPVDPSPLPATKSAELIEKTDQKEIEDYIKVIFGRDSKMAIKVQHHECSPQHRMYPKCVKNDEIEYSCSIWQINLRYHASKVPGETLEEKCDNIKNDWKLATLIAHKIYSDSKGFWPWTWYKKVGYLEH